MGSENVDFQFNPFDEEDQLDDDDDDEDAPIAFLDTIVIGD